MNAPSILRAADSASSGTPKSRHSIRSAGQVGCLGGSGRTGTVLACMAVLAGVPPAEAVAWVRNAYKAEAVETAEQEEWVRWFAGWARGRGLTA